MAWDWVAAVRMLHVIGASLWVGGGVFMISILRPNVAASGPAGKGFMATALRRGGFGKFFGPAAMVTVITGLIVYWKMGYASDPFGSASTTLLTIGVAFGLLAWIDGLALILPVERRMKKTAAAIGPSGPTPEQAAELEKLGAKMGKRTMMSIGFVLLALVLMSGRYVLTS